MAWTVIIEEFWVKISATSIFTKFQTEDKEEKTTMLKSLLAEKSKFLMENYNN